MSLKRGKDVPQLVENYRDKYPDLDRDLLRKLIRLENPNLFLEEKNRGYSSNLRKLDRYLGKSFKKAQHTTVEKEALDTKTLTPEEIAIRYFQWRGTPKGGNQRLYRSIFGEPEKAQK